MKLIKNGNVINLRPGMEVREQRYMKHLASALGHYLESPQGTELVCVLGSGYEKDNRQALTTWVAFQRDEIFEQRVAGRNPLDYLIDRLEDLLRN